MENLEDDLNNEIIAPSSQQMEAEVTSTSTASENLDSSVEIIESVVELVDLTSAVTPQPSTSSASNSAGAVGSSNTVGATGGGGLIKTNLEAAFKDASTHNTESLPLDSLLDQNPSTSTTAASTSSSSATGNVLECPICLQTCIHPARLPCGHIFCFLCVKGVAYKNRRCAMCRREIPPEFLDHPQLVNGIEDICTTKATDDGYQWFYEGRNGGWWAYEKRNACEIEEAFQKLFNKRPQQPIKNEMHKKKLDTDEDTDDDDTGDEETAKAVDVYEHDNDHHDYSQSDGEEGEVDDVDDDHGHHHNLNRYCYNIQICGNIYTVDFQNMIQYPQTMPYRKRKICRAKGLPSKGVAGLLKRWWQYDDRTSQDLEDSFKKGERSCTILVAGYVYIVDFDAMIQQRQNEPARCRRVKRDLATIPKKGVAGLRIEGNTVTTDSNFAAQVYQSRQNRYRAGELLNDGDLDSPNNAIIRTHSSNDLSTTNPQGRLHLSYGGLGGYVIELGNPSEFVSTAAATDAALRIASDIIGSTLAHADELTRSNSNNLPSTSSSNASAHTINNPDASSSLISSSGELSSNDLTLNSHLTATPMTATTATPTSAGITSAGSVTGGVNLSRERGSRELLGAAEDLLGATQRVIATADQPTIDLFQQTLNDFHALTLRDIVDSGSDEHLGTSEDLLGGGTQRVMTMADQPRIDLFQQTLNNFHALNMRNIVDSSDEDNEQEQRASSQSQTQSHQQQNQHSTSTPPGQRSSHNYNQENP